MTNAIKHRWIAVGSLFIGVFGGAAGAQIVTKATPARSLETGIFTLAADDRASFTVTLRDDVAAPANVRVQFFDEAGASAFSKDALLQPGQSWTVSFAGPRVVRARADLLDASLALVSQPTLLGTVEVRNKVTAQKGPVCTLVDYGGDGQPR